jgi:hypothetical protein
MDRIGRVFHDLLIATIDGPIIRNLSFNDLTGRPRYILEQRDVIRELV